MLKKVENAVFVCHLLTSFINEGNYIFIMECALCDLFEISKNQAILSENNIKFISANIAVALKEIHEVYFLITHIITHFFSKILCNSYFS